MPSNHLPTPGLELDNSQPDQCTIHFGTSPFAKEADDLPKSGAAIRIYYHIGGVPDDDNQWELLVEATNSPQIQHFSSSSWIDVAYKACYVDREGNLGSFCYPKSANVKCTYSADKPLTPMESASLHAFPHRALQEKETRLQLSKSNPKRAGRVPEPPQKAEILRRGGSTIRVQGNWQIEEGLEVADAVIANGVMRDGVFGAALLAWAGEGKGPSVCSLDITVACPTCGEAIFFHLPEQVLSAFGGGSGPQLCLRCKRCRLEAGLWNKSSSPIAAYVTATLTAGVPGDVINRRPELHVTRVVPP